MHETYCGKTCADCAEREQLNCPGCRMGPGRAGSGDCSISRCSVSKGHHACDFCDNKDVCRNRRSSVNAPKERLRKIQQELDRNARQLKKVQLLGKWLWIMFWLVIASNVISFVFGDTLTAAYPTVRIIGSVGGFVISAVYSLILFSLADASEQYRYSGIFGLICLCLSILSEVLPGTVSVIISILALVFGYLKEFREYSGHSDCVAESDTALSEKWCNLCYWFLGGQAGILIGTVLGLFGSGLGGLLILLGGIALLVAAVLKLVYLYKTSVLFKNYLKNIENST